MGGVSTQDFSIELRPWFKLFEQASRHRDYARTFEDFITMFLTQFCLPGQMEEQHKQAMQPYDQDEKKIFNDMFHEMLKVFKDQIEGGAEYYDLFGHAYEAVSGHGKRSHMAQYFTPEAVVEMSVRMVMGEDKEATKGKRVMDPACGSGRMIFVAHALYPGCFTYGQDIDPICVKMTAINMMLHGCIGQVVCGDTLQPDDYRFGYKINSPLPAPFTGYPSILDLPKEESLNYSYWQERKAQGETIISETPPEISKKAKKVSKEEPAPVPVQGQQLTIF